MRRVDSVPSVAEQRRFPKAEGKGAAALEEGREEGEQ